MSVVLYLPFHLSSFEFLCFVLNMLRLLITIGVYTQNQKNEDFV